ncbi:MAG: DinB family protein [Gemmatimonadetes bacterium]|nr:DinB family protein [Gemmatimonadota bacterium]
MSTGTPARTAISSRLEPAVLSRILEEGYGPGAWHGPDLQSAVSDVSADIALLRPAPGRHSIAEIVLHHAWFVRSVIEQLTGRPCEPFVMDGEEWFAIDAGAGPGWPEITATLNRLQNELAEAVKDAGAGRSEAAIPVAEQFHLVLGITCHAVYHAGQIQLVRRLLGG